MRCLARLSSARRCFDIGSTTCEALERYRTTGNAEAGSANPRSAGNGCIMLVLLANP